jgi:hypothetical protein
MTIKKIQISKHNYWVSDFHPMKIATHSPNEIKSQVLNHRGEFHNESGPAIVWPTGGEAWYKDGNEYYTEESYLSAVSRLKFIRNVKEFLNHKQF